MLKLIKIELELIPHSDMCIFFEQEFKGWNFLCFNRQSKTNNKYLETCNPKQESKHIIYLDMKNLYRYAKLNFFQPADSNGQILKSLT